MMRSILIVLYLSLLTPALCFADRLLILGDSLTAGYGVERSASYPSILESLALQAGSPLTVINGGMSGDTSAGGLRRLDWFLRETPTHFMLALGANDALRGLPPETTEQNLGAILTNVRGRYPSVKLIIAGMEAPPNMGEKYQREFRDIFPRLAKRHQATLIPFLLSEVAGHPELNQPDRIHPNELGHQLIASSVLRHLNPLLSTAKVPATPSTTPAQ